jgi:hypothetical protein
LREIPRFSASITTVFRTVRARYPRHVLAVVKTKLI